MNRYSIFDLKVEKETPPLAIGQRWRHKYLKDRVYVINKFNDVAAFITMDGSNAFEGSITIEWLYTNYEFVS